MMTTLTSILKYCVAAILLSVTVGMALAYFKFSVLVSLFGTSISSLIAAGVLIGIGEGKTASAEEISQMKEFIKEQEEKLKEKP